MTVRNTVLITLDAVRADRLSCYGFTGHKTPHLDALAADGVRFANAMTVANATDASHASILTSTYPTEHGVRMNAVRFDAPIPTIAEVLAEKSLHTMGTVSVEHLSSHFGLDRGFQTYYDNSPFDRIYYFFTLRPVLNEALKRLRHRRNLFRRTHWRLGEASTAKVVNWLRVNHKEPFFAWVHYFDAHNYGNLAEYDAKVRYVDTQVGRLVHELQQLGVYEQTVFFITSDHGELLEEREGEWWTHGRTLLDRELRVPLIIGPLPGAAGLEVEAQVRTIDMAPTILDMYGLDRPAAWRGESLLPWMRGERTDNLTVFAMSCGLKTDAYCIRTGDWKYIHDESGEDALYDLRNDPQERHNLVEGKSAMKDVLRARLQSWWVPDSRESYTERDAAVVEDMLRDLGYLDE